MKITDLKAYPLKTRTALVRVSTDAGVEGIGECSPMNVPIMCHFVETALRPIVMRVVDINALSALAPLPRAPVPRPSRPQPRTPQPRGSRRHSSVPQMAFDIPSA